MIKDLSIPVFTGIIGYITNWSGIWMLFNPLEFKGFTFPGLKYLAKLAPRKVQQIPGVMHGGVGWQGIIPSRAAKMGSIAVDKTIAKIGSASDFYESLDPEELAEHILNSSRSDIRELVRDLKRRGIGILITDHNVRETLDIVDRACIIYDGQVLFQGTPEALVADQEVRRLYLGESFAL